MSDGSVPFRHPWPERIFGEVGSVTVGGTPSTSVPEYWGGDIPWMASGDVHGRVIDDVPTRISRLGLRHSSAKMVDPPSVSVALAGQGRTRGTAAYVRCALCSNQSVALLKGNPDELDTEYLLHNLSFRYSELRSRSAGGGRAGLTKTILEQLPLPLPACVPEQSKIAEVLSTVDRAIEQTEAFIAKQQRIKTGVMQDLLTRGIDERGNLRSEQTHKFKDSPLGRIPAEWDVATVDQIASVTTGDKDTQDADPSAEYPFFVRSQTIEKISSYSFDGEAVLTAGDGVGTGKVFHYFNGPFDFHQRVYCIHSFIDDVLGYYFFCHFQTHFMARVAQFSAKGSVDSVRRHMIAKMLVPKPGRDEQAQLVNILRSSAKPIDEHTASLRKLRHLKAGLMQDLLTGDRRVTALLGGPKQAVGA